VTSAIGFGCAGLFRLPRRGARRAVLDAAYDAGIRHFDVAPMYGLGAAEAELAPFLRRRRAEVTITTKFGIDPTLLTRSVARVQAPLRAVLASRPGLQESMQMAGEGPHSGRLGRLLYSSPGYQRDFAQLSLERSLRALGTDWIDVFLLHDPAGGLLREAPGLAGYLDDQQRLERIRCWGVTGQPQVLPEVLGCLGRAPVVQFRDDVFDDPASAAQAAGSATITFGALARALPLLRRYLTRSPGVQSDWSERLGLDLAEEPALPSLLLRAALQRNPAGPVLFSTTRPERAVLAAQAAAQSTRQPAREAAFSELTAAAWAARSAAVTVP
jgi:D-threo-aldose 1-dehydrogenase